MKNETEIIEFIIELSDEEEKDDMKFEEEKDDPYKQLMRKQAIFQGLPVNAQAAIPQTQTGAQQAGASLADVTALLKTLKLID